MAKEKEIWRFIIPGSQHIVTIIVMLCILITAFPTVTIFIPLMYIIRKTVSVFSKLFRPDLAKMVTGLNATLVVDDMYTKPKHNLVLYVTLQGRLDIGHLRKMFVSKVLKNKNAKGQANFLELKQYPVQWMGFSFWKDEENFEISNHINYYNGNETWLNDAETLSDNEIQKIKDEVVTEPFTKRMSPWNILIVPKVNSVTNEDESELIFKIHHSLADGHSTMKIIQLLGESNSLEIPRANFVQKNIYQKLWTGLAFVFRAPYDLADHSVQMYFDRNCLSDKKSKITDQLVCSSTNNIPMSQIKEVAYKFNSSVSEIVYAAFASAVRKAMMKKDGKVPTRIMCSVMLPVPNRPRVMGNHWTLIFVSLPVGEQDPKKRLKIIQEQFKSFKNSTLPSTLFYGVSIAGGTFHWLIKLVKPIFHLTCGSTSFPGPKSKWTLCNLESNNVHVAVGPMNRVPVIFTTFSYNKNLRMWLSVRRAVIHNQSDSDEITQDFQNEVKILKSVKYR